MQILGHRISEKVVLLKRGGINRDRVFQNSILLLDTNADEQYPQQIIDLTENREYQ